MAQMSLRFILWLAIFPGHFRDTSWLSKVGKAPNDPKMDPLKCQKYPV